MYKTPKTEKKGQAAEDTIIRREAETQQEATLCNRVLQTTTSLAETTEDNRAQWVTEGPMGRVWQLRKDQEAQEEVKCDRTSIQTAR